MAATVSNLGRGNYVLGGLGAVRGPSAADAMIENQQEARAAREAELLAQQRRQQMQLAQSEEARAQSQEARAQATFEAQQAARAAAQAQRAAQQRAFAEYTRSLREAPTIPEARVRRPVDNSVRTALTPTVENPFPLGGTGTGIDPRSRVPLNVEPPAGPRVGATRGRYRPGAATDAAEPLTPLYMLQPPASAAGAVPVAAQGPSVTIPPYTLQPAAQGPSVTIPPYTLQPAGQPVRAEFYGIPFDVFPDDRVVNALTGTELLDTPENADLRAVLLQQAGMGAALTIPPYTLQPAAQGPSITIPPYTLQPTAPTADAPPTGQPVRAEFYGIPFDVYSDDRVVNALTNTELPTTSDYDELRAVLLRQAGGVPVADTPTAGLTIPPYTLQPLASAAGGVQDLSVTIPPYTLQPPAPAVGDVTTLPYTPQSAAQGPGLTIPTSSVQGPFVPPGLPAAPAADVVPPTPASAAGAVPVADAAPTFREVNPQASALVQDVQGLLRQGDIARALSRIQVGLSTGVYGPMGGPIGRAIGYAFDRPEQAARRTAVRTATQWFNDPENERMLRANPQLLVEAAIDPIGFAAQQRAAAGGETPTEAPAETPAEAPAEAPTEIELTGKDPFITEQETEAGPIAGLTPAGERDPVAATEAAVRAAPDQDASGYFIDNPNLVLDLQTQMARERQMLEARLRYAEATQNIALYEQTFEALNSRERVVNENMISGQIAIIAAQQDNFGPLQEFLSRARPNDNVQVIPYTDGNVSFFVNGREDGDPIPVADLLEGLAQTFNTEYRAALAAAAELQAEREQFLFENATLQQLQAQREISVEQAKALAGIEAKYGEVELVSDLRSGDKLFQVRVPGQGYVQFRVVEAGEPLVNGLPAPAATIEVVPNDSLLR